MNKEKYNRAIEINNSLNELQRVKEEIKDTHRYYLTYAKKADSFGDSDYLCPEWIMKYISNILDKHDKMIRQEIDCEIAALNNKIEEL